MLSKIAEKLSLQLIENDVIQSKEREIYVFGIKMLVTQTAHALLVILLGYCFGLFYESFVFLITYMPLRIYAGGYHASSNTRCFMSSALMMVVVLLIIKGVPIDLMLSLSWVLGLVSLVTILYFAPVENSKKLLDAKEKIVYKKKTYGMLMIIISGMIGCFFSEYYTFGLTLALSLFSESVLILVEVCPKGIKGL